MLYGRRLDEALAHVSGSRYALVHAVAKRARQITLWLTADPAELRAEAAPPPAPGELATRDPVALAEAEILRGEVVVRWDPEGRAEEKELPEASIIETEALLLEGLGDEEDEELELAEEGEAPVPPLAQALEAELGAGEPPVAVEEEIEELPEGEEMEDVSFEAVVEDEAALDEGEEED